MKLKIMIVFIVIFTITCNLKINNNNLVVKASYDNNINKPLVMLKNNHAPDLNYNNYSFISTNLKSNIVGKYFAKYQEDYSNQILSKDIYVIDSNKGEFGVLNEYKKVEHYEKILKYYEIEDQKELLITTTLNESTNQDEPTSNLYLVYIEKGNIIWRSCFIEKMYCSIKDIIVSDDEITLLGQAFFPLSGMDFFLTKFNFDGKQLVMRFYSGMGYDNVEKVLVDDDKYYICGYTTSYKGLFTGTRLQEDSFILSVDKVTLKEEKVNYYAEEYNDCIIDMCSDDKYLYLVKRFVFMGKSICHKVIKIEKTGKIIKEYQLICNNAQRVISINCDNEQVIVTLEDKVTSSNNNGTFIWKLNKDLKVEDSYIYEYYDYHKYLVDSFISNNQETLLYMVNTSSKVGYYLKTINLLNKEEIIDYFQEYKDNDNLQLNGHTNLIKIDEQVVNRLDNYIIRINNLGTKYIYDEYSNPYDFDILLNGQKAELSTETKLQYDLSSFGIYENLYYFNSQDFEFCYYQDLNVLPNISVKTKEIYDCNLNLTFNGKGILNDKVIDSGYVIKKPGVYHFVLEGKDNKTISYEFEVKKLSESINETEKIDVLKDELISLTDTILPSKPAENETSIGINLQEELVTNKNKIILWPIVIPSILAVIASIIIIKELKS